jgi:hypothetical protein
MASDFISSVSDRPHHNESQRRAVDASGAGVAFTQIGSLM